ncbi:MAG: TPM domain-containing protein [Clostridia bacterium]|nr:TPM domain-containing protein [Clostridia bacterium]
MLKRILCLLMLCALLLCSAAQAEPRYPAQSGVTTDSAAVLSVKLLEDLRTLDKRLDKAGAPRLHIATVDFLDTADVQDYANALFTRWELADDDVLLLLCVGEERYAIAAGNGARRILPDTVLSKLMAGYLHEAFLGQQYDAAVSAFATGYVSEVCKACGVTVKVEDLFRSTSSGIFGNWAGSQKNTGASGDGESFLTREDKNSGFSLLKVILIVALLMLIFGAFRTGKKLRRPAGEDAPPPPPEAAPKPAQAEKPRYPVYFKPREKKPTPQYFKPRNPK